MLKIYIRALQHSSDVDETVEDRLLIGDRPKPRIEVSPGSTYRDRLVERSEEDLKEVSILSFLLGVSQRAISHFLSLRKMRYLLLNLPLHSRIG